MIDVDIVGIEGQWRKVQQTAKRMEQCDERNDEDEDGT